MLIRIPTWRTCGWMIEVTNEPGRDRRFSPNRAPPICSDVRGWCCLAPMPSPCSMTGRIRSLFTDAPFPSGALRTTITRSITLSSCSKSSIRRSSITGDVGEYESLVQGSPIGYTNPKVTALLKELRVTFNPNEEDRIYREHWPIFQADLPATFLYPEVDTTVALRRVRGLSSPYRTEAFRHMDDLWLQDES